MNQISKLLKTKKRVLIQSQRFKLEVIGTKNVNKVIKYAINSMNEEEYKSINVPPTCYGEANKQKNNSSKYDKEGEGKTLSTFEK